MEGRGKDGVFNAEQLKFKMVQLITLKSIPRLIDAELNTRIRNRPLWRQLKRPYFFYAGGQNFISPRYLAAVDKIQTNVFTRAGLKPGNYEVFGSAVKHLLMLVAATVLEEYGLPFQVTLRLESQHSLGASVDGILNSLRAIDTSSMKLPRFETEMLKDAVENL